MFQQFNISRTTFGAYQKFLFNLTSNVANIKTPGFKASRVEFSTVFPDVLDKAEQPYASDENYNPYMKKKRGADLVVGIRMTSIQKNFAQGPLEITKNEMDLAIQGNGFLQFRDNNGEVLYSRAGNLKVDVNGVVRSQAGYPLEPEIRLPENTRSVSIDEQGRVFVQSLDSSAVTEIAQIPLANFPNPEGLKTVGKNMYEQTIDSGEAIVDAPGSNSNGRIVQYARESSNVDLFQSMMDMIMIQRGLELMANAMNAGGDMIQKGMTIVDKT